MTVAELIQFLQTQPQDALVAYKCFSEQLLLEQEEIEGVELCPPRPDGWVQNYRTDIDPVQYVVFPGN